MANAPKKRHATYADVEALPPNVVGEIVDGDLFVMPRPRPKHANAQGALIRRIGGPFQDGLDGPGGWWILPEPELHLVPDEPVVPDVGGWRWSRMPTLPDAAKIALPPDWLCEVLSDSTEVHDRRDKMPLYARHGVRHVWLIDPIERYLEAFWNDAGAFRPVGKGKWRRDERVRAAPFEDVEIDLATLWGEPRR